MPTFAEFANRLLDLALSVIPVEPRGKHPLIAWTEFQNRRATPEEVVEWGCRWPDANIGIVTGKISNIAVIDVDGAAGEVSLDDLHLPDTWTVVTGRGTHFYFRYAAGLKTCSAVMPGIDIRTDGGYVVAPGSVHEQGHRYAWATGRDPSVMALGDLPPNMIEALRRSPRAVTTSLLRGGSRFARAAEGARNATCTSLAGYLLAKGMRDIDVSDLLSLWNQGNQPPLSDREIQSIVSSVSKYHAVEENAEFHPQPLAEVLRDVPENLEYLWGSIIESNGLALLAAMPKAGKSVFTAHLAKAVSNGTDFLGYPTKKTNVLLIEMEDSLQRIKRRYLSLSLVEGVEMHHGKLDTRGDFYSRLRDYIAANGIGLTVINTLSRYLRVDDENDAREVAKAMAPLIDIRNSVNCAFLMVHHANKMDTISPRAIRGSTDLFAAVDTALILRAEDQNGPRDLTIWSRDPDAPSRICYRLEQGHFRTVLDLPRPRKVGAL